MVKRISYPVEVKEAAIPMKLEGKNISIEHINADLIVIGNKHGVLEIMKTTKR